MKYMLIWKYFIVSTVIVFLSQSLLLAKSYRKKNKINIAVSKISANNCKVVYASAAEDMLIGKIFNAEIFTLLERTRMNLLLNSKGVNKDLVKSNKQAAKIGKILAVDKVVVGSISKLEDYRLDIRVVNVKDATVDVAFSESVSRIDYLEESISKIVSNIKNYYLDYAIISGDYDFSVLYSTLKPFGDLTTGLGHGKGLLFNFHLNRINNSLNSIVFSTGFYAFELKKKYLESVYMYPLEIYFSSPYAISDGLIIYPSIGAGYMISVISSDTIENRIDGNYIFEKRCYYNPMLSFRFDVNLKFYSRYYIIFAPKFSIFFEKEHCGILTSCDIGIKILF